MSEGCIWCQRTGGWVHRIITSYEIPAYFIFSRRPFSPPDPTYEGVARPAASIVFTRRQGFPENTDSTRKSGKAERSCSSSSRLLVPYQPDQVPEGSIISLGSTVRNGSYPVQPQPQQLPDHKMNVHNRQKFDGEVDSIVNYRS